MSDLNIQQLGKYLSDNCSPQEREAMELWINESLENRTAYEDFKEVWKHSAVTAPFVEIDVNEAWEKLNIRIDEEELHHNIKASPVIPIRNTRKFIYTVARIAAVVVLAFGLYFFMGMEKEPQNLLSFNSNDVQEDAFILPDNSEVFLNKATHIEYPAQFATNERLVQFEGEAFFDIAHNPNKPFIIASGDLRVKVLGTSFNFCSCPGQDEVVLYLETGKVLFYTVDPVDEQILEQIVLSPGQKGIYNKTTGLISREDFNGQNHKAWKSGVLEFVKAPLTDVFKSLEKTYDIQVVTNKSFDNLYLTARYNRETPDQIFESLHLIFGLEYEISGQKVSLH